MRRYHISLDDPVIFKKALGNLLKKRGYHVASPILKNRMLMEEYSRIASEAINSGEPVKNRKKEQRNYKRILVNLYANISYRKKLYKGTVVNLSKNGMGLQTEKCLPLKSKFELLIKKSGVKVPVRVSRLIKDDISCRGMGIKILEQQPNYKKLFDSFR